MKLNTRQVADKLGCSTGTVGKLIKNGQLHDVAVRKEGATKHFYMVDSKELNEFAKTYKNRKGMNGNSNLRLELHAGPPITNTLGLLSKMNERIEAINEKLDTLIRMWS